MSLLTLLVGLPLAVYTLAGLFTLLDFADKASALALLTARLVANLLLLAVVGVGQWPWLLGAYACVLTLHALAFVAVRWGVRSGRWISERID